MDSKFFHAIWGNHHRARCAASIFATAVWCSANSHLALRRRGYRSKFQANIQNYTRIIKRIKSFHHILKKSSGNARVTLLRGLCSYFLVEAPAFAPHARTRRRNFVIWKFLSHHLPNAPVSQQKRDALDIIYCSQHGFFLILISILRDWHLT